MAKSRRPRKGRSAATGTRVLDCGPPIGYHGASSTSSRASLMNKTIADLHAKASAVLEKYKDQELYDYLMDLAGKLEDADMMKHQFGYLLLHAKSTVAAPVRTRHFQDALERAEKFLKKIEDQG